jgi:predicted transcriptional regulator
MHKAFLSYSQLKENLAELTENWLLAYDESTKVFKTTEKGLRFVNIYDESGNLASASELLATQRQKIEVSL